MRPSAIIADDETLMRAQLRARLGQAWPELEIVAEARNGDEAIDLVQRHAPDFAFLDIQMPGRTGIDVARELGTRCHVVFVTAYSEFAVAAFEEGAVDYVLKPADPERLARTVGRLRERLAMGPRPLGALLDALARQLREPGAPPGGTARHLQWIQASVGAQVRLIPVDEVCFFQADTKYTRVQTATLEALIRKPIRELVAELDPARFWQIHRSAIVNVHAVAGVVREMSGRQLVQFRDIPEKLEVSRNYTHLFRQM
jgi:DNA-binding LytR/AlgR family response regulator